MFKVSYFPNIWTTKPQKEISFQEIADVMAGPLLKVRTEAYRRYIASGMTKEAEDVKLGMPGVTVAGVCRTKREAKNLKELSGCAVLDWDDTNGETSKIVETLKTLPYVCMVWISISGCGVKAVVRVDADNPRQYATAYSIMARTLSGLVGAECDQSCKDIARYCSLVYDPGVYYNSAAEVFPWRKEGEEMMSREDEERQRIAASQGAPGDEEKGDGCGVIVSFLNRFLQRNAFVKGQRHDLTLKLGRLARSKNFSPEDLAVLERVFEERVSESDFPVEEIRKALNAGYQFVCENPLPPNPSFSTVNSQQSLKRPAAVEEEQDEQRELSRKTNQMRAEMPHFPDEVYKGLPEFLKRVVQVAGTFRERDMLLMGAMTHLSACLPGVNFLYQQMEYSPHLYFAGVSHAGTGKGIVTLASYLSQPTHDYYASKGSAARKAYQEALEEWEVQAAQARKNHHKADFSTKPEEPAQTCLMIPANSSKARVYAHLRDNGDLGGIIHASEINTLVGALGQDYGKQDDVFCAAFHHEDLSSSFKVDGAPIIIRNPKLAMCMTGTPDQFANLIRSQENGLYSRMALLTAETQVEWRSAQPVEGGRELRRYFKGLGKEVLDMHKQLLESPTLVLFTNEQWTEHTDYCAEWLKGVAMEGDDSPNAIVMRIGVILARLASVFTALRKCEDKLYESKSYICTDADFRAARLMAEVLMEHSLLLCSSLPELGIKSRPLREFHSYNKVLLQMNHEFTYREFVDTAVRLHWSASTGQRLLKRAKEEQVVVREGNIYRKV